MGVRRVEVILAVISAAASVLVAIVGGIALVKQAKVKADNEAEKARANHRAEQRHRESLLYYAHDGSKYRTDHLHGAQSTIWAGYGNLRRGTGAAEGPRGQGSL